MSQVGRLCLPVAACLLLGACGIFGDDDELEPAELVDYDKKIDVRRAWSNKLGGDAEFLRLALRPAGDGNRIYASSADGKVSAFEPESGRRAWQTDLDVDISAGPGVGEGFVVVVSVDGHAIALDAESGAEQWRTELNGESLSTPLVGEGSVIIQTVDNRLRAYDVFDGRERWSVIQTMPALTQRGTASPVISGSTVVTGFDNGRVIAIDLEAGTTEWEALLAPPSGRSDLERLSDVDGNLAVVGQDIYASGYQGRVAALAAESGQVLWAVEASSYVGVAADWTTIYTVQEDGIVLALSRRTGAESWRQDILLRREPTLPVPFNTAVVTGDFEGYLHFFSNVDGEYVARVKAGGGAVSNPPVVVANRLYVQTDGGTLLAYEIREPERPERAPDIADEDT